MRRAQVLLSRLSGDHRTGIREWFYNLRARVGPNLAASGVLDSSAVFIEGPPEIVSKVIKLFESVRVHNGDFLLGQ